MTIESNAEDHFSVSQRITLIAVIAENGSKSLMLQKEGKKPLTSTSTSIIFRQGKKTCATKLFQLKSVRL